MKRIKSFQCCTCISPAFSNLWSINSLTDRKTCHERNLGDINCYLFVVMNLMRIYQYIIGRDITMKSKTILYDFIKHPFKEMYYDYYLINLCLFRHQSEVWYDRHLFVHFIYVICCVLSDNQNKNDFRLRTKLNTIHKTPIIRQTYPCST